MGSGGGGGNLHPPSGGSGTGSRLLHYFSMNRVDSRGLRWIPVDSAAADKRLTSNVLDHKLRVVSQLPKHARTGSTPLRSTTATALYEECFRCASIVHGSVRLSAGRRAGLHVRGGAGTSCAAVRLSCASVRRPRVRVAGARSSFGDTGGGWRWCPVVPDQRVVVSGGPRSQAVHRGSSTPSDIMITNEGYDEGKRLQRNL